jgi:LmbE family N-acetylglucosaminyl deacetylase
MLPGWRPVILAPTVLIAATAIVHAVDALPQDRGAAGTWQKLLKLRTIASVMHTTAHPDDEHGGLLAMLSRGEGARVTLLTLNRGEAGDNAIGSELFDALGLIRTEELLRADQYYGVDQQYFTSVIDYGFSKRLEEALVKWGRENVLRDVVRVIRMERPLVLIARFQGNDRDGHGNHQTAGLITREAYKVAGDPDVFPEQIRQGLRPWQPLKLYMGDVRENEDWTIRADPAVYSPWLGESYANFARAGLSFQRSQNGGRNDPQPGPAFAYYKRLATEVAAPAKETGFFDGIDTSLAGLFTTLRQQPPANARTLLDGVQREVETAIGAFRMDDPSAVVPSLARGLAALREASRRWSADTDAAHILRIKEGQFADVIHTALGLDFAAVAQPSGLIEPSGPTAAFAAPPTMTPVVPGQSFDVKLRLTNRGSIAVDVRSIGVADAVEAQAPVVLERDETVSRTLHLTVPTSARFTQPHFSRASIFENRYTIVDRALLHAAVPAPAYVATANYRVTTAVCSTTCRTVVTSSSSTTRRLSSIRPNTRPIRRSCRAPPKKSQRRTRRSRCSQQRAPSSPVPTRLRRPTSTDGSSSAGPSSSASGTRRTRP